MRNLTTKQKKLLDQWTRANPSISSVEDLTSEQWEILENINDTEILYQNVNRYLGDKYIKQMYQKPKQGAYLFN